MHDIFRRRFQPTIMFENDDPGGSSTVEAKLPDDVVEGFRNLISKEGGGKDAAATLFLENKSLRDDRRDLQEKLEQYESIAEDPEELQEKMEAYQELGDPEDVKEKLEKGQEAIQERDQLKTKEQNAQVAEVYDWNAKVLNRLSDEDAEYEVKTRKNDEGEDEKYAVIKTEDGEKDLQEYAQENWDDMMPALKANGQSGDEKDESSNEKKFSKQKSSSDGKSNEDDPIAARIERNKKKRGLDTDDE